MIRLDGETLFLSGDVSLVNLMAYRHAIENQIPESAKLVVDLSELTVSGSAVLSLLVFLRRRASGANGEVRFTGCSDVLRNMARVAELEELLGLPV